jgi:hypothetical protein
MKSNAKGRGVSLAILIPLLLIVFGIFVWGLQYKLSLYNSPGNASRLVPEAKLLSPNERPQSVQVGSLQTAVLSSLQATPAPALDLRTFLIAVISLFIFTLKFARAHVTAFHDARHSSYAISSYFSFRPPPVFTLAR